MDHGNRANPAFGGSGRRGSRRRQTSRRRAPRARSCRRAGANEILRRCLATALRTGVACAPCRTCVESTLARRFRAQRAGAENNDSPRRSRRRSSLSLSPRAAPRGAAKSHRAHRRGPTALAVLCALALAGVATPARAGGNRTARPCQTRSTSPRRPCSRRCCRKSRRSWLTPARSARTR